MLITNISYIKLYGDFVHRNKVNKITIVCFLVMKLMRGFQGQNRGLEHSRINFKINGSEDDVSW